MTDSGFENASIWGEWHFVAALPFFAFWVVGVFFFLLYNVW